MKLLIVLASFIIILVFLTVLAMLMERYWRAYQAERAATKANEGAATTDSRFDLKRMMAGLAKPVTRLQGLVQPASAPPSLSAQLRQWITRDLQAEPALQSWLLALPEPGFDLLTQHIADFCTEMNFELQWLVAEELAVVPPLEAAMKDVIVHYCTACQQAIPAQQQIRFFTTYRQLVQPAKGRQDQHFRQEFYAALTKQGLVKAPAPADLITATEAERQQQAIQAIQQAAARDWSRFTQLLQTMLTAPAPEPTPPANDPKPSHNGQAPQAGAGKQTQQSTTKVAV